MTTFTTDWFSYAIDNFKVAKTVLQNDVNSVLEIGVYQGRSTCWQLENMLNDTGTITCIDPFIDYELYGMDLDPLPEKTLAEREREQLFRNNVAEVKKPGQTVDVRIGRSFTMLADLIQERKTFDFIYIDGNHASHTTLADGVMCFGMLRPGGVMIFDDYLWDHESDHMLRPKTSIDAFCNQYRKYLEFVFINYQLAIIKNRSTKMNIVIG